MLKYKTAYTLIEILLVIVIITTLTLLGVSLYRQKIYNDKVEQAANEMELLSHAASIYFIQKAQWPAADGDTSIIQADFIPYIPLPISSNKTVLNPWGNPYILNGKMYFQLGPPTIGNLKFLVKTQAPDINTAQRIAQLLPFKVQQASNPQVVMLYSSFPGVQPIGVVNSKIASNQLAIVDTVALPKNYSVNCPINTKAGFIVGMRGFISDFSGPPNQEGTMVDLIKQLSLNVEQQSANNFLFNPVYEGGYYTFQGNKSFYHDAGHIFKDIYISTIAYCENLP